MVEEPSFIFRSFTLIMSALKIWKQIRLHLRNVICFLSNLNVNVVDSDKSNSTFNTFAVSNKDYYSKTSTSSSFVPTSLDAEEDHPSLPNYNTLMSKWASVPLLLEGSLFPAYYVPTANPYMSEDHATEVVLLSSPLYRFRNCILSHRWYSSIVSRSWRHILCLQVGLGLVSILHWTPN